jgi:hypothetical protein
MRNLYILLHSYTILFTHADLGRFSFETSLGEKKLPERLHRGILQLTRCLRKHFKKGHIVLARYAF